MTKHLTFEKENNHWYIKLNNWVGAKHNLMMVAGADTMLDELTEYVGGDINAPYVEISFDVEDGKSLDQVASGVDVLTFERQDMSLLGGANYKALERSGFTHRFWLCPVTLFVYQKYPRYFSISLASVSRAS